MHIIIFTFSEKQNSNKVKRVLQNKIQLVSEARLGARRRFNLKVSKFVKFVILTFLPISLNHNNTHFPRTSEK